MKLFLSIFSPLLCFVILGAHLSHLIFVWDNIPSSISLMYSGENPNQTGSKLLLFLLPVLTVILWIFLQFLRSIRKKFNYINLTEENKVSQYNAMNMMLISIQTLSFVGLMCINEAFLRNTLELNARLFETSAIILLVLCVVPPLIIAIWARTSFKEKRTL